MGKAHATVYVSMWLTARELTELVDIGTNIVSETEATVYRTRLGHLILNAVNTARKETKEKYEQKEKRKENCIFCGKRVVRTMWGKPVRHKCPHGAVCPPTYNARKPNCEVDECKNRRSG